MIKDILITRAMQKFLFTRYAVDNTGEGWDCLNSIASFYRDMGVEFPERFEDWTWDNYGKKALEDPEKAHKAFERFVQTLGREIDPNYMVAGDLLLVELQDAGIYAGIYLGEGKAFFMFDRGAQVVPWPSFPLVSARRLIE